MAVLDVTLKMERREDGGLRIWSANRPEVTLSHSDPHKACSDIGAVLYSLFLLEEGDSLMGDLKAFQAQRAAA